MSVLVIGRNGRALMPTNPRKARLLLKKKTASVVCRHPFTIQLLYKTGCATQEGCIGIDTGSQHIGVGITCGDRVILKDEHTLRSSMEKRSLLATRAVMRRGRRYRKVRYRKPKWRHHTKRMYFEKANRRGQHWRKVKTTTQSPRSKGWLPPSLQSKCDHHFRIIDRYLKYLPDPITRNLVIETGRFDMARMNDPTIHGEMYQRGPMYDAENLRAYIFARDNYQCACCKAKAGTTRKADGTTVKLVAHHILFRSRGATDNPKYIISVCDHCHTTKAHQPGGILYSWMENNKKVARGLRDATFMNILRKRLFARYPQAAFTYGNITAADRKQLRLPKSHANDAVAISLFGKEASTVKNICQTMHYKQIRKSKRSLHEAIPRKGRKNPNTKAVRNKKNTTQVNGFKLWDSVLADGKKLFICSFTGTSVYLIDKNGCYISQPGKTYKQWPLSKLKRLHPNGNWLMA